MRNIIVFCCCLFAAVASADHLALRKGHPNRYIVKQGDTLWDIAAKFLDKPWQWQQIWRSNPHIENPDKIYPGAVLELHYANGQPVLSITRSGTVILSPRIRSQRHAKAIPPIPLDNIRPFLIGSQVLDADILNDSPEVIAFSGEHLFAGPGIKMYVAGLVGTKLKTFAIFRDDKHYEDPVSREFLGFSAFYIGEARLIKAGSPATLMITEVTQSVKPGDRLLPGDFHKFDHYYFSPKPPKHEISGQIIALFGGITQIGGNQVIAINRGVNDGMEPGDVLAIYKTGELMRSPQRWDHVVKLPSERIGEAMVFRTFTRISYALIMRANSAVNHYDIVTNP